MRTCAGRRCTVLSRQRGSWTGPRVRAALHRLEVGYKHGCREWRRSEPCSGCRHYAQRSKNSIWCAAGTSIETDPASDALDLLGWDEVCSHVAAFATTVLGRERVQSLSAPNNEKETKLLQAETIAGCTLITELAVRIDLGAVSTEKVKVVLQRASKGALLNESSLLAVAKILKVTQATKKSILGSIRQTSSTNVLDKVQPIFSVWKTIMVPNSLIEAIEDAIDEMGEIRDSASVELRSIRGKYRSLKSRLEKDLRAYGGAVTLRAGRVCVGLPSGGDMPSNALVLSTSNKEGLTYVEPKGAVELNNQLIACWGEMKTIEESILWELTNTCMDAMSDLTQILEAVVQLDVVRAKAKYTSWIRGVFPVLITPPKVVRADAGGNKKRADDSLIHITNLRHPLLEGHYLLKKQVFEKARKGSEAKKKRQSASDSQMVNPPVPITICLNNEVRALIVTGPNTGGKTATLKALGLVVLMARAGLGVPAEAPVRIPYYSAVFADIGDEQSLTSNLSTFSGHLKRIQAIRDCADGNCLVLLDELGTGSDPDEGAALGASLLKALVKRGPGGALTTVATTHHGLLASLAFGEDSSSFQNASVEFDEEKLIPTYRLMIGVPGRSNALVIAARLGMSSDIIEAAKEKVGKEQASLSAIIQDLQTAEDSYLKKSATNQETLEMLGEAKEDAKKLKTSIAALKRKSTSQKRSIYQQALSSARGRLAKVEKRLRKEPSQSNLVSNRVKAEEKDPGIGKPKVKEVDPYDIVEPSGSWPPRVGDVVFVPKLRKEVKVLKVGPGQKLQVTSGGLSLKINTADIARK